MTAPFDPTAALTEFIGRVAPYDPAPESDPVAMVGVRTASGEVVYTLSDHVARALCSALAAYRDPKDFGTCQECGSRAVDENLHCRDCGRLHGILGQVIGQHARRASAVSEES